MARSRDGRSVSTMPSDPITLVIADDHAVVRKGLHMLLEAETDFQVVGEAGDVPEAIRLTAVHQPRVLLLDLSMPGGSSLDAIPELAAGPTAVVVLTMQSDPSFARQALERGARGFVLKEAADVDLLDAIRLAASGGTYVNPRMRAQLAARADRDAAEPLTDREREVLRLIALGHTNAEIADRLRLSTRTVETHRAHIQQKIGRRSRAGLVRYAFEHALVGV
jgi:two-component system response regulator NreC